MEAAIIKPSICNKRIVALERTRGARLGVLRCVEAASPLLRSQAQTKTGCGLAEIDPELGQSAVNPGPSDCLD